MRALWVKYIMLFQEWAMVVEGGGESGDEAARRACVCGGWGRVVVGKGYAKFPGWAGMSEYAFFLI